MRKQFLIISIILIVVLVLTGCKTNNTAETPASENGATGISGRIIEIVSGEYIIIRNEEDTSIYFKIDISEGLTVASGIDSNLNPDNVITADVKILNADTIPRETELVSITGNKSPDYKIINAEQALAMMVEGDVLVVDVRTRTEYESGYIPEAYNVPLDQIEKSFKNVTENKDDTILVYCRSGNRSKVAARILTEMGYTNVYDFGGIVDWPYDIEGQ